MLLLYADIKEQVRVHTVHKEEIHHTISYICHINDLNT